MNKRLLGNTGISVSEIAFGGVEIGIPYGIGVHNQSDMLSHGDAIKLLHAAVDGGINLFDTARLYGESELIMGKAFHDRRDKVVLSTKCKHFRDADGRIPAYPVLKKTIEASLEESFLLLRTDYADVFMLHQADMEILENEDVSRIFSDLKQAGRIRATGASTYSTDETEKAIESGVWDVIQLPFNLMDQRQQLLFAVAEEKGIGLVIRSVLLKGLLSSKGRGLHPALKDVEEHVKKYNTLINERNPDLPTLATKFALSFKEVTSVLVGIDRTEYLIKSLEAADGNYFSEMELAAAMALNYPDPEFLDLPKWDRLGWLK
jgi:aryl-alcohol dehydrogenase-like predicted oxidoreductase